MLNGEVLTFATSAASASRGLMERAISRGVVPRGTSFLLPSGRVTAIMPVWTVCDIENSGGTAALGCGELRFESSEGSIQGSNVAGRNRRRLFEKTEGGNSS